MDISQTIDIALFIITIAAALGYVTLISRIFSGWEGTPEWKIPQNYKPTTKISIIIAARNEEGNILNCLNSLLSNKYPLGLYEIIVIDDKSTDRTLEKIHSLTNEQVKTFSNAGKSGKKAAISLGIKKASGDLIISTDADCILPPKWLETLVSLYERSGARLIAGPIQYKTNKTTIERFQYMDGINNMAVTANGIQKKSYYMANGANLAYEKSLFEELSGFSDKDQVASGDDMYMIQSAAKLDPNSVRYLKSKDAIVLTQPESKLSNLINQRKRWATKTSTYTDKRIVKIQGYVFFFVSLLIFNLTMTLFGSGLSLFGFLFGLFIKLSIDYMYLSKLQEYFESKDALKYFLPASFMFLGYILIAGWWAIVPSKYAWKDRNVK